MCNTNVYLTPRAIYLKNKCFMGLNFFLIYVYPKGICKDLWRPIEVLKVYIKHECGNQLLLSRIHLNEQPREHLYSSPLHRFRPRQFPGERVTNV